jgi:Fe2+ or Zn2+ uptake regulation protein
MRGSMELSQLEKIVLQSFINEQTMTLKMITNEVQKKNSDISKQRIWNVLQLLLARGMVKKVDRGVYKVNK